MGVAMRTTLRWLERALFLAGTALLAGVFVLWQDATFTEIRTRGQLREMLAVRTLPGDDAAPAADAAAAPASSFLGYLAIPRLSVSVPVLEGVDARTLNLAAGHLPETPLPWDEGNAAIAGHRDTVFRGLKDVRKGDELTLVTGHGDYRYRVRRVLIVEPDEVWVLQPWDGVHLTLVTCYPFTYVGPSPQRFIVHAERVSGPA